MHLDILGIAAHPDDIELSFGGTLLVHQQMGYKTGIIDLTEGELGTRGTPEIRKKEAAAAAKVLSLSARDNLGLPDGFFENNRENQLEVVKQIRKYRPKIVITNSIYDRHPDHTRGAQLVETACFLAGLREVKTTLDGIEQEASRPDKVYFSIQSTAVEPDVLIDISDVAEKKMEAVKCYHSQFFDPDSVEPETYISSQGFITMIESRSREFGQRLRVPHAEGFQIKHFVGVKNLFDLV
ncbi:MAG: bacillithiol biosynthesis deacetylase BshB1 [Bacteroidota bacterium]